MQLLDPRSGSLASQIEFAMRAKGGAIQAAAEWKQSDGHARMNEGLVNGRATMKTLE